MQNKLKEIKENHKKLMLLKEIYGIDESIIKILRSYCLTSLINMGVIGLLSGILFNYLYGYLDGYLGDKYISAITYISVIGVLISLGSRLITKSEAIYLRIYSLKVKDTTRQFNHAIDEPKETCR